CVVGYGVLDTCAPATSLTMAIFDNALDPSYRSRASESARRTRLSSNGFFWWLMATMRMQSHGLSWTVILSPSAVLSVSRSAGEKPRNWMWARSPRIAATWADEDEMKRAR